MRSSVSTTQVNYERDRNNLISHIEDMRRDLGMSKYDPRLDLMDLPELEAKRDDLMRELELNRDLKDAERVQKDYADAEHAEIDSLRHLPGETELEKMPPGGKMARRYEGATMRITRGQLRKIISEEVARVISELDILNADTGELLAIDYLPSKYEDRISSVDGYDALYDKDFEALRKDVMFDPDVALDQLGEIASEMSDEVHGDLGTAIDLAKGLKMSYPKKWASAIRSKTIKDMYYDEPASYDEPLQFETIDDALTRWLAERMG